MRIEMLGAFGLYDDSGASPGLCRMPLLVLAAIAASGSRGLRREVLADKFWPDRAGPQAKACLRQVLTALRKVLAQGRGIELVTNSETVRLEAAPGCIDLHSFEKITDRLFAEGAPDADLERAAELYRGPFMDGIVFDTADQHQFIAYREMLHDRALRLVEEMSRRHALGTAATRLATRLLNTDPAAEEAHRALIRIALNNNRVNRARRQLELCRKALLQELEVEPEPETVALVEAFSPEPAAAAQPKADNDEPAKPSRPPESAAPADPSRGSPLSGRPSIVVLPFVQLGAAENGFFVDGMVNELTTALSRMREFLVVSRQSAYTYKERFVDARAVGKELGVAYIVDGTVQMAASKMLVIVQLVETDNGEVTWSGRFQDNVSDMFDLQEQIAHKIAGAIHPSIRNVEIKRVSRSRSDDLDAYGLVMKGYPRFWLHTPESNSEAIALFGRAIAKDPPYGHALALKAWCHAQRTCYLWTDDSSGERAKALECAQRAELCVGDDATALAALGATYTMVTSDRGRAQMHLTRCLEIDPCNAWGWMRLGWMHALSNEPREALANFERAERLSPMDPFQFNIYFGQALAWSSLREFDRAIELVYKGIHAGHSVTWAYRMLASFYALAGDKARMVEAITEFRRAYPKATMKQIFESLPPQMIETNANYFEAMKDTGLPAH